VARHMFPLRLDRHPSSQAITRNFTAAIASCSAVIADLTALNENVMYEIGYAHGRSLTPMLFSREPDRLARLPLYFRNLNVRPVSETQPLASFIEDYLRSIKTERRTD